MSVEDDVTFLERVALILNVYEIWKICFKLLAAYVKTIEDFKKVDAGIE